MNPLLFLLDVSTTITPSDGAKAAETAGKAASSGGGIGMSSNPVMLVILYCVVIFGVMYFLSIRPQKKKEKQLMEMRNAIQVGDSVLLNNGLFGKVVDTSAECFVIEFGLNRGIRIPVMKQEVLGKREPNLSNQVIETEEEQPKKLSLFKKKDEKTE